MKKLIAILLALLLVCGTLMSCDKDVPGEETIKNQNNPVETKPVDTDAPEAEPVEEGVYAEQYHSQQGFSIKGKGYSYKGNELMKGEGVYPAGEVLLLNVTNETDTNYSVLLSVTYFDENGEKIKTDSQRFKQFAAGFERYFLFTPQAPYASYTCDLSLTEYTGDVYVDKFHFEFEKLTERNTRVRGIEDTSTHPVLFVQFENKQLPHPLVYLSRTVIVFDNTGEIYHIQKIGEEKNDPITEPQSTYSTVSVYYTTEKKLVVPEKLTGELEVIVIYDIVK